MNYLLKKKMKLAYLMSTLKGKSRLWLELIEDGYDCDEHTNDEYNR